ncbi:MULTISPECIES: uracil-DNA glycosylase [unclassified Mesorhizobium]|uniref:uracil-DNA glycosylase n=1 Tax=unclassified Mesorhizobium TaxID=325217 RepID=UPI001FDA0126|nr:MULTISPECIES: uracil-DNA glycosylase [unclassified Mesorhizobium]
MPVQLRSAMIETLAGWHDDIAPAWRAALGAVSLDFDAIDPMLELEPWEPIFPSRRDKTFPGAPKGAHMLRAFDGIAPEDVRCVILGQDPYPEPGFSTGRAFEAGNVAAWRELDKMFSKSIRAFTQQIVAARTGNLAYARSFADWPATLAAIEDGQVDLGSADVLAQRWVDDGVLLLNASLTLSRFKVEIDPHQSSGHLPLWRPLILAVLHQLAGRGAPVIFIGFGDAAAQTLALAGIIEGQGPLTGCILRDHPARADAVLTLENPFLLCNRYLEAMGAKPVAW